MVTRSQGGWGTLYELLVARGCEEPGAEEADDPAPLRARNAALEAENTALRAELARIKSAAGDAPPGELPEDRDGAPNP